MNRLIQYIFYYLLATSGLTCLFAGHGQSAEDGSNANHIPYVVNE